MKLLKGICGAVIAACLVCVCTLPLMFDAGTITFTTALRAAAIIMIVVLVALGTYLAATDDIKTPLNDRESHKGQR